MNWDAKKSKFQTPAAATYFRTGDAVGIDGTTKRFVVGVPGYGAYSGKAIFGKVNETFANTACPTKLIFYCSKLFWKAN